MISWNVVVEQEWRGKVKLSAVWRPLYGLSWNCIAFGAEGCFDKCSMIHIGGIEEAGQRESFWSPGLSSTAESAIKITWGAELSRVDIRGLDSLLRLL